MGRERRRQLPPAEPIRPETPEGWGAVPGMEGAHRDSYTLIHTPSAADDEILDMRVRPRTRTRSGATVAVLGKRKLSPNVLVDDPPGCKWPIVSTGVITIIEKKILTDEGGDYALVRIKFNRKYAGLAQFIRQSGSPQPVRLQVTLFLDMDLGGLIGPAAGIGLPAGALQAPVKGETKLSLVLNEWKIHVAKPLSRDPAFDLAGVPGQGAALAELAKRGGTLDVYLDACIKVKDGVVLWNEKPFIDGMVQLERPGKGNLAPTYVEQEELYRFAIEPPPGASNSPYAPKPPKVLASVEVWPEDGAQNRLIEMVRRVQVNDAELQAGGKLNNDAEVFLQACVEFIATKTRDELATEAVRFTNATHAVTYFQGFTEISRKAFKTSLDLHKQAYDRFMENLVAGVMELLFFLGDDFFKKIFNRVIKSGADVAGKELQAEMRTLAHEAAEEAERTLLAKQQVVEATRNRLREEGAELSVRATQAFNQSGELLESLARHEVALAEHQAAKKVLEEEVEALTRSIRQLEQGGVSAELSVLKAQADKTEQQLKTAMSDLADDQARLAQIRTKAPKGGDFSDNANLTAWNEAATSQLEARIARTQSVVNGLQSQKANIATMESSLSNLASKNSDLMTSLEHLPGFEANVRNCKGEIERLSQSAAADVAAVQSRMQPYIDAEAEAAMLGQHLDVAQAVKTARGTEEQIKQVLDQAIAGMPPRDQLRTNLVQTFQARFKDLQAHQKTLQKQIAALESIPQGETAAAAANRMATMQTLRQRNDAIESIFKEMEQKINVQTSETILKQYTSFVPDIIKAKFNERAGKIREALINLGHIDYKAIPGEFYNQAFDKYTAAFLTGLDWLVEKTAHVWNYISSTVVGWFTKKEFGSDEEEALHAVLSWLAQLSFWALTLFISLLDCLLAGLMKVLEAILYCANIPNHNRSSFNEAARTQALGGAELPGRLPDAFFRFSNDLMTNTINVVHPKNVSNHAEAGKAGATVAIKQHFAGAYREYYEPQWERARQFMVELAGANGALNPGFLTSEKVQSTNRDATSLLQTILAPLRDYETTLKRPADRELSTILADVQYGDYSPADFDKMFELIANAFSLGLKIVAAGMLVTGSVLSFTPLAPGGVALVAAGGGVLVAGGFSDRLFAGLRLSMVAFFTMPDILTSQFDVMRLHSLAYQNVFHDVDLSTVTNPDPSYYDGGVSI